MIRMAPWAAVCLLGAAASGSAFEATASIEGQVFHAGTGAPLRKATVRLVRTDRPSQGGRGGVMQSTRETDAQGRFAFTNLDAGRYSLSAERQGFLRQAYGAHKFSNAST